MLKRFNITIINGKPTCAELAGYELPSYSRCQEDDVEVMAETEYREYPNDPKGSGLQNNRDINCTRKRKAFIKGYHKARKRYEFTKQDLIDLVQSLKDYTYESGGVLGYDEREASEFVDIFLNGRNRTPIAIEVEFTDPAPGDWQPILNPDGTVKGTYIFNE